MKGLNFNQMSAMGVMMSMNLECEIAILNILSAAYHCIVCRISKSEAINLVKKVEHYKS